ncbi:MAG: non-homologous end-joining DNA ligase [Patescibacteria group bacterium]
MLVDGHPIDISHRQKVLYPEAGVTKGRIISYYKKIWPVIQPHLADRPISMLCAPDGISHATFYRKRVPSYFPDWISRVTIPLKKGGTQTQVMINTKADLIYVVDQACVALHPWLAKQHALSCPDKLVFDLDPGEGVDTTAVVTVAKRLNARLPVSYVMTTGGKGFHVVVPLVPTASFGAVRGYAKAIAHTLAREDPDLVTASSARAKRTGRVFVDYLRNGYGQTSIAPYAVRLKPQAGIATPLRWDELTSQMKPKQYTIKNILRRLSHLSDPWADIAEHAVSLETLQSSE